MISLQRLFSLRTRIPSKSTLLALGILVAGSPLASAQELGDHTYATEAIERGSRIYSRECALCHGPQGDIVDGVNLRTGLFKTVQSDDELRRVVYAGAGEGQMPAFGLNDTDLNAIVAFIRAGFDPEGVAIRIGDPVRGKSLFDGKGECADCHRVNGIGPRTAPDLSEIGAIRTPSSLQQNLLDPAGAILPINRPIRIVTRSEETVTGRRLNEDTYTVQVIDSNERLRSFRKSDLVSYEISMQPSKAPTTLSSDEVADVVGYLLTLRGQ
ncbi:MAG: c-type cytochrome [Pseudomonadales bacterium]|nr:c-type cytochrome [Pseudomonadales bacterium]